MNENVINIRASDGSVIKMECHDSLVSTVSVAKAYAKIGYPDRYVVMTERRTKIDGDGKVKGYEKGIYLSCILRPSIFPAQTTLLNPLSAVAFAQALEEHTRKKIGIGWISSIYCDSELIGNVQIEGKLDNFTSYEYLIVTFSCALSEKNFPSRISDLIKKVFSEEKTTIPLIIAQDILNKFFPLYQSLKSPSKFMDTYKQKFLWRGKKISCVIDDKKRRCTVMGIDSQTCSLLLEGRDKNVFQISTPRSITVPKRIKI